MLEEFSFGNKHFFEDKTACFKDSVCCTQKIIFFLGLIDLMPVTTYITPFACLRMRLMQHLDVTLFQTPYEQASDVYRPCLRCSKFVDMVDRQIKCSQKCLFSPSLPSVTITSNVSSKGWGNSATSFYSSRPLDVSREVLTYNYFF